MRCKVCGQDFTAHRSDALYCGQNCRKRASRKGQRINQDAARLSHDLSEMAELLSNPDYSDRARGVLLELLAQISNSLLVTPASVTEKTGAPKRDAPVRPI